MDATRQADEGPYSQFGRLSVPVDGFDLSDRVGSPRSSRRTGGGPVDRLHDPRPPLSPPGPEPFGGSGLCFELEVDDARAAHDLLVAEGLPVTYPLTDEPVGQRRFGFAYPSGPWVDVVEQIAPQPGFWDPSLA